MPIKMLMQAGNVDASNWNGYANYIVDAILDVDATRPLSDGEELLAAGIRY